MTSEKDSANDKLFFVIYVEEEESFSTVHHTDVIYNDHVKIGDVVTFFWCKKKHEGTICYIGGMYISCWTQLSCQDESYCNIHIIV